MKAVNIMWSIDIDDEEEEADWLPPDEIVIPEWLVAELDPDDLEGYADAISDYISDETGFCHKGFELVS